LQSEWTVQRSLVGPDGTYYYPELEERYLSLVRNDLGWSNRQRTEFLRSQTAAHLMDMRRTLFEMPDREALRVRIEENRNNFERSVARRRVKLEAEHARWEREMRMDLDRVWFNRLRDEFQVHADREWSDNDHDNWYKNAYDLWPMWDYTPEARRRQDRAEAEVDRTLDPFNPNAMEPTREGSVPGREGSGSEDGSGSEGDWKDGEGEGKKGRSEEL
jgi:hypothetical protein